MNIKGIEIYGVHEAIQAYNNTNMPRVIVYDRKHNLVSCVSDVVYNAVEDDQYDGYCRYENLTDLIDYYSEKYGEYMPVTVETLENILEGIINE